jgi:hypothetical protein
VVVMTVLDRLLRFAGVPVRSDAPPALIRRCSKLLPRAAASPTIRPGRSLRAVKLLPMKRTLTDAPTRTPVAIRTSPSTAEDGGDLIQAPPAGEVRLVPQVDGTGPTQRRQAQPDGRDGEARPAKDSRFHGRFPSRSRFRPRLLLLPWSPGLFGRDNTRHVLPTPVDQVGDGGLAAGGTDQRCDLAAVVSGVAEELRQDVLHPAAELVIGGCRTSGRSWRLRTGSLRPSLPASCLDVSGHFTGGRCCPPRRRSS